MLALAAALVGFVPAGRPLRRCPDQRASRIACAADDAPDGADFRASLENIFVQSAADEDAPPGAAQLEGELIRNLPLWRVQWAASPGGSQVYNVHVPHYTHMFTTLVGHARLEPQPSRQGPTQTKSATHTCEPRLGQDAASAALGVPGLFGHLLLPGGSASLGDPTYSLEPGSSAAPLVGVVMQLIEVLPLLIVVGPRVCGTATCYEPSTCHRLPTTT